MVVRLVWCEDGCVLLLARWSHANRVAADVQAAPPAAPPRAADDGDGEPPRRPRGPPVSLSGGPGTSFLARWSHDLRMVVAALTPATSSPPFSQVSSQASPSSSVSHPAPRMRGAC